jgi:uncharacterized LabA/DUF88 family protein
MKRIAVFADVSNLYYCVGKRFGGRKLNYATYMEYIKDLGEIQEAIAYGAQLKQEARGFIHCLRQAGFTPRYKTPKSYVNDGDTRRKADWDVGIALDMVNQAERVDMMILGSADGDLTPAVEWVQARGVTVIVLASGISRELKQVANEFIEIPESMLEEPRGPTTQTVGSASTTVDLNAAPVAEETPVETEPETTI